jgi:hypothetical protein
MEKEIEKALKELEELEYDVLTREYSSEVERAIVIREYLKNKREANI